MFLVLILEHEYPSGFVAAVCTTREKAVDLILGHTVKYKDEEYRFKQEGVDYFCSLPPIPGYAGDDAYVIEARIVECSMDTWNPVGYTDNSYT
jgi:hypothetical protein